MWGPLLWLINETFLKFNSSKDAIYHGDLVNHYSSDNMRVSTTIFNVRDDKAEITFGVRCLSIIFDSGSSIASPPFNENYGNLEKKNTKKQLKGITKGIRILGWGIIQNTVTLDD